MKGVKKAAVSLFVAAVCIWAGAVFLTLRQTSDTLSLLGADRGQARTSTGAPTAEVADVVDRAQADVQERGRALDSSVWDEVTTTPVEPTEESTGTPGPLVAVVCRERPGGTVDLRDPYDRYCAEQRDPWWSMAAESRIAGILASADPLPGETQFIECRSTLCAITSEFRPVPLEGIEYIYYDDPQGYRRVQGWYTAHGTRVTVNPGAIPSTSPLHQRGHEIRLGLIKASHIEDGSPFIIENTGRRDLTRLTIYMFRCPRHFETCEQPLPKASPE